MDALLLVDIQNDFVPGGALAVARGDEVVAVANRVAPCFAIAIATQDHHPRGHRSFASQWPGRKPGDLVTLHGAPQVLWPDHCVQGTHGAALHAGLDVRLAAVIAKGEDREVDSYSGFFDNGRKRATALERTLRMRGVDALTILGLATDYCVLSTVLDALSLGFPTRVLVDGCRAVDLAPGDGDRALARMRAAGAVLETSAETIARSAAARVPSPM